MRNLMTIIKKELRRFFTDRRMMISLLLPGLMIFLLYTIMGDVMTNNLGPDSDYQYQLVVENEPDGFGQTLSQNYQLDLEYQTGLTSEVILEKIEAKELDLYVVFPADFAEQVEAGAKPTVIFHFNAASNTSTTIYSAYTDYLSMSLQPFTLDANNHATDVDTSIMIITGLVPFLLITFLFSGAMAVAPESIAGEKERGTIASLLITPVKRSHIALGKIIALSLAALTSAASSFIGLMASLPKLIGGQTEFNFNMYGVETYILLLLVIISTVLIFIVLISLVSAFAKSIKEATSMAMPLMIVVMLVGVTTLMGSAPTNPLLYLIPVYNSVNSLLSIFSMEINMLNFGLTIASNLVVTGLGVYVLTLMFNSEKVMFRK